ncbi:hypothetical protein ARMSODRAFT_127832 [Armillaria solidipes]|uniref:Uncharacterized protein n=1 Tax=Armillaria solidipes TaxID=1076256 RepID=A0A2H3BT59_9AGAR|nr:hypothetical protein ARMSODRAFT_127832 [Armillaria solidipes]
MRSSLLRQLSHSQVGSSGRIPYHKEVLQGNRRLQDVQVLKLAMSLGAGSSIVVRSTRVQSNVPIFKRANILKKINKKRGLDVLLHDTVQRG